MRRNIWIQRNIWKQKGAGGQINSTAEEKIHWNWTCVTTLTASGSLEWVTNDWPRMAISWARATPKDVFGSAATTKADSSEGGESALSSSALITASSPLMIDRCALSRVWERWGLRCYHSMPSGRHT
mmetsp:Transcript_15056/g.20156  ORF Transcript_15056/g.20156 Transcript_15056/m.20156 type:complete len:127 (+) Transcript_15056:1011-1391(+)